MSGRDTRQLVILAGGLGTRLRAHLGSIPKPMARVAGKPLLEHQVELACRHGFTDIRLLTSSGTNVIEEYFGDGRRWGAIIHYHIDRVPLGTAGAVLATLPLLAGRFVVLYGDILLDVDLDRMWQRHVESGADATLLVHPNDHPKDSDLVETDTEGWIKAFHAAPHPPDRYFQNLVNGALYVVERSALEPCTPSPHKLDFARDLFPRLLAGGGRLYGYRTREYIKDIGTPERLAQAEADHVSGRLCRLSLREPCPAVFLDRDGTLNEEVDRVKSAEELIPIPGIGTAIRKINRHGFLASVVTNQPVVARGECSESELRRIHDKLETLLGQKGAYLDGLYFCPHHPNRGFKGERAELKIRCTCRKPQTGLIARAQEDLNIDLAASWMVGDSTVDLQTARNARLRSILVRTGHGGDDHRFPARADFEFFTLSEAVNFITSGHAAMLERAQTVLPECASGSILAIGGLARSGKSLWSSLFVEVLADRGQTAQVLSLDLWLKSESERTGGDVRTRFDLDAIGVIAGSLARRTGPLELTLGAYQRTQRRHLATGTKVKIEPRDVIIFEGVLALDLEPLRQVSALTVFIECSEEIRRGRFYKEYAVRGYTADDARRLYEEREVDEHPIVRASAQFARLRIGDRYP